MSSTVTVSFTYAHTVTYVTEKMLLTLKEIIRDIGLNPGKVANNWGIYESAISTWLTSRDLQRVVLEVYNPQTNALVTRWDMDVAYSSVGDGSFWVDTAAVRYAIAKAGLAPSTCKYDLILVTSPGCPDVPGWGSCDLRSTASLRRYAVGSTIGGDGISAKTGYWSS